MNWPDGIEGLPKDEFVNRWDSEIGRWIWEQGLVKERLEDPLLEISNGTNGVKLANAAGGVTNPIDEIPELDLETRSEWQTVRDGPVELPANRPVKDRNAVDSVICLLDEFIDTAKEVRKFTRRERHLSFLSLEILGTGEEISPEGNSGHSEDSNRVPDEYQETVLEV